MSESKNLFSFLDMPNQSPVARFIVRTIIFTAILFMFLVSLKMMGGGFKLFGKETATAMINATSNPFVSLFIGMLATAIIQSSSTTTSMIVGMTASGVIGMEGAVPLIMGANIGTSVTSSIVSFGHLGKKQEYRKAIAAATVHDFFNILVTLVLFPLEYFFGFLSSISLKVAEWIGPTEEKVEVFSIMKVTVKPVAKAIEGWLDKNPWLIIIVAVILLFIMLRLLTLFLKSRVIGSAETKVKKVLFKSPLRSLLWGVGMTTAVQSSSVTTSLMVPMVASGKVSLKRAFPFMMGANIGTTTTALIAAFGGAPAGVPIALAHLFFNLIGVGIFFPIKQFRDIPLKMARNLGRASLKNKFVGIIYIGATFFLTPFLLIFFTQSEVKISEFTYQNSAVNSSAVTYTRVLKDNKLNTLEFYSGLEKDSLPKGASADDKINIEYQSEIVSIDKAKYLTSKVGLCVDNVDNDGEIYSNCLESIHEKYSMEIAGKKYISKKCYEYKKQYADLAAVDSAYSKVFIDPELEMILKTENYNKKDELISTEKLVRVPEDFLQ